MEIKQSKWLLVYTKAREEERAKKNLENQGFETFLPMIAYEEISESKSISTEPMFPRYLFTVINAEKDNWADIKSTRGVSHLVMFGAKLAEVPNSVVEFLKTRVGDNHIVKQRFTRQKFEKGDKLVVKKGALKGKDGKFLSTSGKERVRILLKLMNKLIIAEVPGHDVDGERVIIETLRL